MKYKHKVTRVLVLALATMVVAGALFTGVVGAEPLKKVRLGTVPWQDDMLPYIWTKKGWDKEIGLDIDIKVLEHFPKVALALAAGAFDVVLMVDTTAISMQDKFQDMVLMGGLLAFDDGYALLIRPDGSLKTLSQLKEELGDYELAIKACAQQLKGRSINMAGNTDHEEVAIDFIIEKGGLEISDVNWIDMSPNEGLAAFLSGTEAGDVYVAGIAQRYGGKKRGLVEMVTGKDMTAPTGVFFAAKRKYYEENPDVIAKVHYLWYKTIRYIDASEDNLEELVPLVLDELNRRTGSSMTVDDFKEFWQTYEHFFPNVEAMRLTYMNPESPWSVYKRFFLVNRFFLMKGRIKEPVKMEDIVVTDDFYNLYIQKYPVTAEDAKVAREFYRKYVPGK